MARFIGEIRIFGGSFAPSGWALCNGQSLLIQQNAALFAIIGVYYGGDGKTTFCLPDLRGRSPVGVGLGTGLSTNYILGQAAGAESVTLSASQVPAHSHTIACATGTAGVGTQISPAGGILAIPGAARGLKAYNTSSASLVQLNAAALASAGSSTPAHNNMAPYLTLNFIIALTGVFPTRS
jgi:microcystin-dependent protein